MASHLMKVGHQESLVLIQQETGIVSLNRHGVDGLTGIATKTILVPLVLIIMLFVNRLNIYNEKRINTLLL